MTRREYSENTAPYDLAVLATLVGEDPAVVAETLDLFVRVAREWLADSAQARAAGDRRALGRLAHRMRSSAHAIGARPLAKACTDSEAIAGSGDVAGALAAAAHAEAVLGALLTALAAEPACHASKASSETGRENR